MRIRYVGPDEARDLAVDGGPIRCERLQWVDIPAVAEREHLDVDAAIDAAKRAVKSDDWEHEGAKKAARSRKAAKKTTPGEQIIEDDAPTAVEAVQQTADADPGDEQHDEQEN